jgi:hypothetical protein
MLKQMPKSKKISVWSVVGLFSVAFILSIGLLAVKLLQKPASEMSFDTRRAAMVDSGLTELNTYPFNQSTLKVGDEQKINLQLNTKSRSIDKIELIFEIIADKNLLDKDKIDFTDVLPDNLEVNKQEIIESTCQKECFTATLLLTLKDETDPFITVDEMVTISQLVFTPQKEGSLLIKIIEDSVAIEQDTNQDILQKPSVLDFQYYVTDNGIDRAQCYFEYSDWSECKNGWQTRQYSVEPDKCFWYEEETLQELSRSCTDSSIVKADSRYFYLDIKSACLNQPTTGQDVYILWNEDKYRDVTWIDVSSSPEFNDFYHKKVDGNIDQTIGDYLAVRGDGFSHATGDKAPLSFEPNRSYFFRLYSKDGDKHIVGPRLYLTYCSGDQSSYKNCNDRCDESSDQSKSCAPGMTCYEGACRNASNPTNSVCLATPGISSNDRSCNQYCANNNDCAAGLSCFWNHCRLPSNLDNTSCSKPVTTVTATTARTVVNTATSSSQVTTKGGVLLPSQAYDMTTNGCNLGCNNNRDCDADMRCYNGKCRLADDPENSACVLGIGDEQDQDGTPSATITRSVSANPSPTTNKDTQTDRVSMARDFFINLLSNFAWQWLAIAGGLLLLAMGLIVIGIGRSKRNLYVEKKYTQTHAVEKQNQQSQQSPEIKIPQQPPTAI